jgi:hypothetical protein
LSLLEGTNFARTQTSECGPILREIHLKGLKVGLVRELSLYSTEMAHKRT